MTLMITTRDLSLHISGLLSVGSGHVKWAFRNDKILNTPDLKLARCMDFLQYLFVPCQFYFPNSSSSSPFSLAHYWAYAGTQMKEDNDNIPNP
jgi:hypothetical protein